jgi:hypothetical protein
MALSLPLRDLMGATDGPLWCFILWEMLHNKTPKDLSSIQATGCVGLFCGFAVSIGLYLNFKCPSCGNTFFIRGLWRSLTRKRCMHCNRVEVRLFNRVNRAALSYTRHAPSHVLLIVRLQRAEVPALKALSALSTGPDLP